MPDPPQGAELYQNPLKAKGFWGHKHWNIRFIVFVVAESVNFKELAILWLFKTVKKLRPVYFPIRSCVLKEFWKVMIPGKGAAA